MNLDEFLWHAKRGHGECILALKKENPIYYKNIVKKVFLNNYAFLINDEYRSAFACELISFYNADNFFLSLLWNKIKRTKIEDYYNFDYLINNLYFILKRNKKINYEKRIKHLLISNLNKELFTFNECCSINSLISLINDLNMNIHIEEIVQQHYIKFNNSNLHLDGYTTNNNFHFIEKEEIEDFNKLLNCILNDANFNKQLPIIATYITNDSIELLLKYIEANKDINNAIKTNILKIILFSNKKNIKIMKKLINILDKVNLEQRNIIYDILSEKKSVKLLNALSKRKLENNFYIRLHLTNYNESKYEKLHNKIIKLKINYSNSNNWFAVENALINYFNKRLIDKRLLVDLKYFFKNGLSSTSRYKIVIILKKYNMLDNNELKALKYDANYKIRKIFKNY